MASIAASADVSEQVYDSPYIDVDEWREHPVRHRYVHGGFERTQARFSFYFPPPERYDGRFFHYAHPWSGYENLSVEGVLTPTPIDFGVESGAYLVESNGGWLTATMSAADPTIHGYRAAAAAARHSRVVAAEMYGEHRPYGYAYGGSGGGFRSTAYLENGWDVWDGAVPFVVPVLLAVPNQMSVLAHACRLLRGKTDAILDAVEPGGSSQIYDGLNVEQREALAALVRMGFPLGALFEYDQIARLYAGSVWACFADWFLEWDPEYFEDFWTVPGYLGADAPESLARARVQHAGTVTKAIMAAEAAELGLPLTYMMMLEGNKESPPVALRIDGLRKSPDLLGATFTVTSGAAAGRTLYIAEVVGEDIVLLGESLTHGYGLAGIEAGDQVVIDNSQHLAYQTMYRHQLGLDPSLDAPYLVRGKPIYPQRDEPLAGRVVHRARGANYSGRFPGKMIMLQGLLDESSWANNAVFYRRLVEAAWGPQADEHYRVWFLDRSMHPWTPRPQDPSMRPARPTRVINYRGIIQQALRDVAAWVEKGMAPPPSTVYEYTDGQVVVPPTAKERKGIQPVVRLTVGGADRVDVRRGDTVEFRAEVRVPDGTGAIVAAAWDFDGAGEFPHREAGIDGSSTALTLTASYAFEEPGVYFPALLVTSQREGIVNTAHTRIEGLGRVRVVVS